MTVTPTQAAAQMGLTAPRVAVIFNGSGNWHFWARLAIHAATQTWGGQNFILLPHDGGSVDPVLLQAARAYDPDYVVRLQATVHQFERAEPGRLKYRNGSDDLILGEDRERLLEKLPHDIPQDPDGDSARRAVVAVCSSYNRCATDGTHDEEHLDLIGVHDPEVPLLSVKRLGTVPPGPYLSVPSTWGGPVALAAASRCGALEEPGIGDRIEVSDNERQALLLWLLFRDALFDTMPPNALVSPATDDVIPGDLPTAFDRTTSGLEWMVYGHRSNPRYHSTLVIGDTANDFAAAYAWDRMYGTGVWLPSELSPVGDDADAATVRRLLRDGIVTWAVRGNGRVTVATTSENQEAVEQVVATLRQPERELSGSLGDDRRRRLDEAVVAGSAHFTPDGVRYLALADEADHAVNLPAFRDDNGTLTMATGAPVPTMSSNPLSASEALTWQVEVRMAEAFMPRGRGLDGRELLAAAEDPYLVWVRSGRDGIRFESHRSNVVSRGTPRLSRLARPQLRELGLADWFARIATQHGNVVKLSVPGQRSEVLRRLLGDRRRLADLFSGPLLPVLKEFLTGVKSSQARYPQGQGVVLQTGGSNDGGYEGYMTLRGMRYFDQRKDMPALAGDVDTLTSLGLLRRGFVLGCDTCSRVEFVELDTAGHINTCPRCGTRNTLTTDRWKATPLSGPRFYFDLHAVARDLLKDHGEVPLQLARHLRDRSRAYTDVAELELHGPAGPIAEVDLIANADDHVLVCEAKSNSTLGPTPKKVKSAAAKRVLLAQVTQADQIILATTCQQWDEASLVAIRDSVARGSWIADGPPTVRIITALGTSEVQDRLLEEGTDPARRP